MFRVCNTCQIEKSIEDYYKFRAICKTCYCQRSLSWQKDNPDKVKQYKQTWFQKTYPQQVEVYKERYRKKTPEKLKLYRQTSREKMPELYAYHRRLYELKVKEQTPKWASRLEIRHFYVKAQQLTKDTGILYTVDHIIPLRGKNVCGLHVENNLQILSKSENSKKGNRL